jgi:hypothetical protein
MLCVRNCACIYIQLILYVYIAHIAFVYCAQLKLVQTNCRGPTESVLVTRSSSYQDIVIHVQYYGKPNRARKLVCVTQNFVRAVLLYIMHIACIQLCVCIFMHIAHIVCTEYCVHTVCSVLSTISLLL